jgi:hypothetical protein
MDQIISSIIPTQRIGNDGFHWWVGQVEGTAADETENKGGYRFKVRIVGDHPGKIELVDTADLPWATCVMPVNVPFIPGNGGGGMPQLEVGCWVIGFYLDNEKQKPIIMGSIGMTPGATKVFVERTSTTPPFTTAIPQINEAIDGAPIQQKGDASASTTASDTAQSSNDTGTGKNTATGGLSDGSKDGEGNPRVNTPARKTQGINDEDWCQAVAEKCTNQDLNEQMTIIMGEFLAEVQNNNGNIGTYLVNSATGGIFDGIETARKYTNKAISVVEHFIAKVKGFIIDKMSAAVKDLINALIYPSEEGNILTPVTEWFNDLLKDLGCQMADLGDRLAEWLTNVLMSYVEEIYKAIACQIDALVNGIISKIKELMEELFDNILGPLQDILGAIAEPLNLIGGAIDYVLDLLGISCSGPNTECSKYKSKCTTGEEKKDGDEDFLDGLLEGIDDLFPATGADYTQYVCDEAYEGNTLDVTTVGFTGGVPLPASASGNSNQNLITFNIEDVEIEEGKKGYITVTRTGIDDISASVKYKTLVSKGSATVGEDYLEVSGILGFAPGENAKNIEITTLYSEESEGEEYFFIKLEKNSPSKQSGIKVNFVKNIGKCTITENDQNPYKSTPKDPINGLKETFPEDVTGLTPPTNATGGDEENTDPTYAVSADKPIVKEGEFVVYTIETTNVANGTTLYYSLTGKGITSNDIIGNTIKGSFAISNNTAKVTVGLEDDGVVEEEEILKFTINGTGAFADVLVIPNENSNTGDGSDDLGDFDISEGETPENTFLPFQVPTVDSTKIITDADGGIIEIPIDNPGDPWAEAPYVFIGGNGKGAAATALLDNKGYLTEIRIKSTGFGYKKNLASDQNVRCIIDTFTLLRPGRGYTEKPTILINGDDTIAEAIINDSGFVIGARTLNREITFDRFPVIEIVGGGGYGAKLLPSLACLDTGGLARLGATKIGTGRYVDCP